MSHNKGKEQILEKCFELLIVKGFDGVSISDLQQATGMSRGLIYHYYTSKEDLFMEITEKYLLEFFRVDPDVIRSYTIPEMISYVEKMYNHICSNELSANGKNISIINYDYLFYQARLRSDLFERKYRKIRDDEQAAWEIVVGNSQAAGHIPADLDKTVVAKFFIYILDGVWFNISHRTRLSKAAKEITAMLTHYYNQIKCD